MAAATLFFAFILISMFVLSSAWAVDYEWKDYRDPVAKTLRVCHDKYLEISVEIPSDFLESQGKYVSLVLELRSGAKKTGESEFNFRWYNCWLKINDKFFASYRIPTKNNPRTQQVEVEIKKEHLQAGNNLIKASFTWKKPNWKCNGACCGYYIRKMAFKNAPSPQYGLTISSIPSKAEIYVDSRYYGVSPRNLELPQGQYSLKLEKNGYKSLEKTLYVVRDEALSYELEKSDLTETPVSERVPVSSSAEAEASPFLSNFNFPKSRWMAKNADAVAVVIGNQTYAHKDIPPVSYALNDALAMKKYLIESLGYKDGNVITKNNASKATLEMIFGTKSNHRGMLYNYIKPKKSDVFIYYSGHGSPDPVTQKAYLVPTDCNPVMMDLTAYPLDVLYGNLPKIEAKSITVVIDACFSGGTSTGKWLVPNASPALIKIKNPVTTMNNINIFTSADKTQVSSWYPEKQHSMFTYFFLRAVCGDADFNADRKITYQEIYNFVADRAEGVPYYAKRLHGGRIQTPTLQASNGNAAFVMY